MERVSSKTEARNAVEEARREGRIVGLVPTMGALHEGHLSLVRAACARTDFVAVSIFVNPTQFGPNEDFAAYPRDIEGDLALLAAEGVDLVFTPSTAEMYGSLPAAAEEGARGAADAVVRTTVQPASVAARWEGAIRPGHFAGVTTVVAKLFHVLNPHVAFFGEKDFQQLRVIEAMVRDLDFPVHIVGCPIVRERDGLALSSRNAYLAPGERAEAVALAEALEAAAAAVAWGERDPRVVERGIADSIAAHPGVALDYAAVVDAETLEPHPGPLGVDARPACALVAARIGRTRLIDNAALVVPSTPPAAQAPAAQGETR